MTIPDRILHIAALLCGAFVILWALNPAIEEATTGTRVFWAVAGVLCVLRVML